MLTRKKLSSIPVFCILAIAFSLAGTACGPAPPNNGASNNAKTPAIMTPTPDPCGAADIDMVIMKEIYAKIDQEIGSSEKLHINAMSRSRVVTLKGWTSNTGQYDKVITLVNNIGCRTGTVTKSSFFDQMPQENRPPDFVRPGRNGCTPPTKQCGAMCISQNDICYSQIETTKDKEEKR